MFFRTFVQHIKYLTYFYWLSHESYDHYIWGESLKWRSATNNETILCSSFFQLKMSNIYFFNDYRTKSWLIKDGKTHCANITIVFKWTLTTKAFQITKGSSSLVIWLTFLILKPYWGNFYKIGIHRKLSVLICDHYFV